MAYFDVTAGKQLWQLPHEGLGIYFSPDGRTVISPSRRQDGFDVIDMDAETGKPSVHFQPCRPVHPNVSAVFSADSQTLVTRYFDGIRTWDRTATDTVLRCAPLRDHAGWGPELGAVSADGRTVFTNLGHLQRWDLVTGKPFFTSPPDNGLGAAIQDLAFTPDGKEMVASSWANNAGRWDIATCKQVSFLDWRASEGKIGRQLIATPGGLRALVCDWEKRPYEITIIDRVGTDPSKTVHWAEPAEVGVNGLRAYTLTTDGKTLLIAHAEERSLRNKSYVTACDVASGRRLSHFTIPGWFVFSRSPFSPCGRWVVLDGKVRQVATGTALFTPEGAPGERLLKATDPDLYTEPVWFSNDGRLLAGKLGREGSTAVELGIWELASGKLIQRFPNGANVADVAFARNGRTVAILDGWGVRLHDLPTGKRLAAYPAPDVAYFPIARGYSTKGMAFAPDGRTLATGHSDGTIMDWNVPAAPEFTKFPDRDDLWTALGSSSPTLALPAIARLAQGPAESIKLLTERFRPVREIVDADLAVLIKNLDSDSFETREEATQQLRQRGLRALAALQRALAGAPSAEAKRRVENLLEQTPAIPLPLPLSGEALRSLRAIEVLERIGTPEAVKLLQAWSEQTRDLRLMTEAKLALGRIR